VGSLREVAGGRSPLEIQVCELAFYARAGSGGGPCGRLPDSRDRATAIPAGTVAQVIFQHGVPGATNEQRLALGTEGVRAIAVDITFIDVVKAGIAGDLSGAVQRFRWRGRLIL
jgi:hypothetical protein